MNEDVILFGRPALPPPALDHSPGSGRTQTLTSTGRQDDPVPRGNPKTPSRFPHAHA
jgi:hypothetical protein